MPFSREIDFTRLNEADVRAEVVDPLLRALGYQAGTENNIVREGALRYERAFLGRKKPGDPLLRGRPDYVIEVGTYGRWLLEAKGPEIELGVEDFEQAQSYALHPNVAASLFVISNGREFRIYRATTIKFDQPLFTFTYDQGADAWMQIRSLLSPPGFRRAVPPVRFEAGMPLADGYSTTIAFGPGTARPHQARCSVPLPEVGINALANMQTPLKGGRCWREDDGRIRLSVAMGATTQFTENLLRRHGISEVTLSSDAEYLPIGEEEPVLFSGDFEFNVDAGEELFNLMTWQPMVMPFAVRSYSRIDATGRLHEGRVSGTYALRMYLVIPAMNVQLEAEQVGEFEMVAV